MVIGKVSEHIAPFLPGFRFNPRDIRFLGSPVDLVVFDGLDSGDVTQIVFIEVKSGGAVLSQREKQIRDAIRRGEVKWEELRVDVDKGVSFTKPAAWHSDASMPARDAQSDLDTTGASPPSAPRGTRVQIDCPSCGRSWVLPHFVAPSVTECPGCSTRDLRRKEIPI